MRELTEHYQDDPEVAFVAIQTAFEGFWTNTFAGIQRVVEKYQLTIPIGHSGSENKRSALMSNYRTGGTPWVILIDREGIVRFNHFHLSPKKAIQMIEHWKKNKASK